MRRVAIGFIAALLSFTALPPSSQAATAPDLAHLGQCTTFFTATVTLTDTGYVVRDNYGYSWDQSLMTRPAWADPTGDSVRRLHAYGLSWLPALLARIRDSGELGRLPALTAAVAASVHWAPDTGNPNDPIWNEGVTLRRLQSVTCLYRVTHSSALIPLLDALIAAASDSGRYYGPPRRLPHNHGLMTDLALLELSTILPRPTARATAIRRMGASIGAAFTPGGMSIEQSSAYHVDVVAKWTDAAASLRATGASDAIALAQRIERTLTKAGRVTDLLRQPDGTLVPFGDGRASSSGTASERSQTRLIDRRAGIVTGRWSWTKPDDMYAARFGPARMVHGHEDRMSVVWWATGRPVLVDPGTSTYVRGAARDWSVGHDSHSVPVLLNRGFNPTASIRLTSASRTGDTDSLVMEGYPYGVRQTRAVVINSTDHWLTLHDRAPGARVTQYLQLDQRWSLASLSRDRNRLVLTDSTGSTLTIATTGRVSSVTRGADGLAGGWTYYYPPARRVAAPRITIAGASSLTTTLRVRVQLPDSP